MPKTNQKGESNTGYDLLCKGFTGGASNLASILFGKWRALAGGFGLTRKGEREWTATLRAWSVDDGRWVVAFGNGGDVIEALLALNASVVKGKWYKDKFSIATQPTWDLPAPSENLQPLGQGQNPPALPAPTGKSNVTARKSQG